MYLDFFNLLDYGALRPSGRHCQGGRKSSSSRTASFCVNAAGNWIKIFILLLFYLLIIHLFQWRVYNNIVYLFLLCLLFIQRFSFIFLLYVSSFANNLCFCFFVLFHMYLFIHIDASFCKFLSFVNSHVCIRFMNQWITLSLLALNLTCQIKPCNLRH